MAHNLADRVSNRVDPRMLEVVHRDHLERYRFAEQYARGRRVLDVGCATGYGTTRLARIAEFAFGIDIYEDAIQFARRHYESPRCRFMQGEIGEALREEGRFDLVVSFEVIEHVPDPVAFLGEIVSVLRDGERAIVSTPNRLVSAPEGGVSDPTHLREYTPDEFVAVLEEGGLEVEALYGLHLGESVWRRHALRARLGRMDVLGLRRLVPACLKAQLIRQLTGTESSVLGRSGRQRTASEEGGGGLEAEVWIDDALEGAYSQIAVCRTRT